MSKIKARYLGSLNTECIHEESGVKITTNAPKEIGGEGKAFSPTDLFAASIASCMLTMMGMEAKKVGFDLKDAQAEVEKQMALSPVRRIGKLIIRIRCSRLPTPQVREKLEEAARKCPIHHSIHPEILQELDFVWGI